VSARKILFVDDEADLIETLRFPLELEGYDVLVSNNGEEALNKARQEEPDLILLDIMLPKMDGYTICRLLKSDEKHRHIPILMLTARTQERDRQTAMQMGADEYITKPFDIDEVIKKIKSYFDKK
jgi:two-component system, OmpR family, alkaline phosphatase synthesis response regulator PhoP